MLSSGIGGSRKGYPDERVGGWGTGRSNRGIEPRGFARRVTVLVITVAVVTSMVVGPAAAALPTAGPEAAAGAGPGGTDPTTVGGAGTSDGDPSGHRAVRGTRRAPGSGLEPTGVAPPGSLPVAAGTDADPKAGGDSKDDGSQGNESDGGQSTDGVETTDTGRSVVINNGRLRVNVGPRGSGCCVDSGGGGDWFYSPDGDVSSQGESTLYRETYGFRDANGPVVTAERSATVQSGYPSSVSPNETADATVTLRVETANGRTTSLTVTRSVRLAPNESTLLVGYDIRNTGEHDLSSLQFLQYVDYDIQDISDDVGRYYSNSTTGCEYVFQEDTSTGLFSGFTSPRRSDEHGLDTYPNALRAFRNGNFNGRDRAPTSGTGDVDLSFQWTLGELPAGERTTYRNFFIYNPTAGDFRSEICQANQGDDPLGGEGGPDFQITNFTTDQYTRSPDDQTVTVEVTNLGNETDTQDVTFEMPTGRADRAGEDVLATRVREDVTLEPGESRTLEFRMPELEFEAPTDVGFYAQYNNRSDATDRIRVTNIGSETITADEVVIEGRNLSGVNESEGLVPLSNLSSVDDDTALTPPREIPREGQREYTWADVPVSGRRTTLRVVGSEKVTMTVSTENETQRPPLYVLPTVRRPTPSFTVEQTPVPSGRPTEFRLGGEVGSYFETRGGEASGTEPTVIWDFDYGIGSFPIGSRVEQTFFRNGTDVVAVSANFSRSSETTFRSRPVRFGTPDAIPPVVDRVEGIEGFWLSDRGDDLESDPGEEFTFDREFRVRFLAPEDIDRVVFDASWLEENETDTDPEGNWSATFDVTRIPNRNEGAGSDAHVTIYAYDDRGRTVVTRELYVTEPPGWAERIYRVGSDVPTSRESEAQDTIADSTTGTVVGEDIVIPYGGFQFSKELPSGVPALGGKEIGVEGRVRYGVETHMVEAFAARYGAGEVAVTVPANAVFDIQQSAEVGAAAEYDVPSWQLNGNAYFWILARTLAQSEKDFTLPSDWPIVGGKGITVTAYTGPGYGLELELSGITGDSPTIDEGIGYANVSAGATGTVDVVGQEVFTNIQGEVEGDAEATIDNQPNRFQSIQVGNADLGGTIDGKIGVRIAAPLVGGKYAVGRTLVELTTGEIERPGPPFGASLGHAPFGSRTRQLPVSQLDASGDTESPSSFGRWGYTPMDGRLTDNTVNDTDPAIAGTGGEYAIAWSGEALDRPQSERREIYVRTYDTGDGFSARQRLTDDTAYNIEPTVARGPNGTVVVAWQRFEAGDLDASEARDATFQDVRNRSEVAYAVYDGSSWSGTRVLTNDSRFQGDPAAASTGDGFVLVWERDGDYDVSTLADESVRYARLNATGAVVDNGTLGDGLNPRAAPGNGTVRIAREIRAAGSNVTDLVVSEVGASGTAELRREAVENLTTFDVASDGVAWASGPGGTIARSVTFANGTAGRTVPLGEGTTVRELRLATHGGRRLLQYQGNSPGANTGFLPNPRTTYYQLYRNGSWSAARTVNQAVNTTRTLYDHAVTADDHGFVSVAAGVNFTDDGSTDELFAVDHEYRPDLTLSASPGSRNATANASVGDRLTLNATVANTGDERTAGPVTVSVRNGTGDTTSTTEIAAVAPGEARNLTLEANVTATGQVRLVADGPENVTELSETNNDATLVAETPDLELSDASQSLEDGTVVLNATVRNAGPTVVTNGSVALVNGDRTPSTDGAFARTGGDRTFTRTLSGTLAPGETRDVTLSAPVVRLNRSRRAYLTAAALAPTAEPASAVSRTYVPLFEPGLAIADRGLRAYSTDGGPVVSVFLLNRGFEEADTTVTVEYGNRTTTRRVCVPAATDEPSARRVVLSAPGLSAGETVTAVHDVTDATPTDNGAAVRATLDRAGLSPPPRVGGTVPADVDCDGVYEDFDGDGTVTTADASRFFDARTNRTLLDLLPRFDARGDDDIDVHDVQAVLSEAEPDPSSGSSGSALTAAVEARSSPAEIGAPSVGTNASSPTVPTNGTRTLAVEVPEDVAVGSFNVSVRTRGDAATVAGVAAVDARYSETLPEPAGGPGPTLVAAGHGTNGTLLSVTLHGRSTGNGTLVVDPESIGNDTGVEYDTPEAFAVPLTVADESTTTTPTPGDGDGDGDDGGGGGGGGGQPGGAPGDVEVTDRALLNGSVTTGEPVVVAVDLANFDPAGGRVTLTLAANASVVTERTVAVDASTRRTVYLETEFAEPGVYGISVEGSSVGTLEVTAAGTPTPTPTPTAVPPTPTPTDRSEGTSAPTPTPGEPSTPTATEGTSPPGRTTADDGPGFTAGLALVALLAAALLARRRD